MGTWLQVDFGECAVCQQSVSLDHSGPEPVVVPHKPALPSDRRSLWRPWRRRN